MKWPIELLKCFVSAHPKIEHTSPHNSTSHGSRWNTIFELPAQLGPSSPSPSVNTPAASGAAGLASALLRHCQSPMSDTNSPRATNSTVNEKAPLVRPQS